MIFILKFSHIQLLAGICTLTILLYMTQRMLSVSKVSDLLVQLCLVPNVSLLCVAHTSPLLGLNAICFSSLHRSMTNIWLKTKLELCFFVSAVHFYSLLDLERLNAAERLLSCKWWVNERSCRAVRMWWGLVCTHRRGCAPISWINTEVYI